MTTTDETSDHRVRVGAERRQRMLAILADAVLNVMAELGPDRTSVDAIIQAAGVSRGTFYKYYDAPARLIAAVGTELAQDLIAAMAPMLDCYDDPAHRLSAAFRTTLHLARENPLLGKFLIRSGWPANNQVPAYTERAAANLVAGIKQGRFRAMPLCVAMATIGGLLIGTIAELITAGADSNIEVEATVSLLLALGIGIDDANKIASMPLKPPLLPLGGVLSRVR